MRRKQEFQWRQDGTEDTDSAPSRSQRKRDSAALQRLGEELLALSAPALETMPLSADLREAVAEWQRLRSHESRRRQLQFIGRLMREEPDPEAIRAALAELQDKQAAEAYRFQHLEAWRDALLTASPEQRARLCADYALPQEKIPEILDLAAKARNERDNGRPPRAYRALFRLLREIESAKETL